MQENRANGNRAASGGVPMSPAIMCDRMVSAEMAERGVKRAEAESDVARRAKLAPSAITNFRKGRIKDVERLGSRIEEAFAAFLARQLAKLEAEIAVARVRHPERDLGTAEAAIARAKEALSA